MKLLSKLTIILSLLMLNCFFAVKGYADLVTYRNANPSDTSQEQGTQWVSTNAGDVVSIQNGTGATLVIKITVDTNDSNTGINVNNCGNTRHINPGSTAICVTADAANPVSFVTDNALKSVTGNYIVQVLR